jgi:cyclic beta-1,2-glucan synthetase
MHAAMWVAWACAELGWGDDAHSLFRMLNPIARADTPAKVDRYQGEPYVVAADISNQAGRAGWAGWTWYTGSAAWMYRLGLEAILGLRRKGEALDFVPCIPKAWPGYTIEYRFGRSLYSIEVHNPEGVSHGVRDVTLDGVPVPGGQVPLVDNGASHAVVVRMG